MNGYSGKYGSSLSTRGQLVPAGAGGMPAPPKGPVPVLNPGTSNMDPFGVGDVTRKHLDVNRVVGAGGRLTTEILHPSLIPFEQLYRRLPDEGMFSPTVNPSRPFTFELGAFAVPSSMALLLFDLRPDIYRFSGVDPGDFLPIESRRLASIMGFDIAINGQRKGQISFELDPVEIQRTSTQAFTNQSTSAPSANASQFAVGAASSFANAAGAGMALQPQRPTRYGALSIPFTIIARSSEVVQVRCVIFRPVPTPIAFIEYDMAGLLVPEYWLDKTLTAIKPPQAASDEEIR